MKTLQWDPEVEAPATIAVIGAGPVGIEAAIYARFLGYFVSIFEERRVAHRMLDWRNRPLDVTVAQCTTPMGHAAIAAQYPEYVAPAADHVYTGRSYAEEYLLPLAKTDLLFDDIHFLSPVADVSRYRTHVTDDLDPQERCNDEFRILVDGRHRGPWTSRSDVVLDCRGVSQTKSGMGPGGGLAIGEAALRETFLKHAPMDRKFEQKMVIGKHVCLIGQSIRATQFAMEFKLQFGKDSNSRLTWIVRTDRTQDSQAMMDALNALADDACDNLVVIEALGVEHIQRNEAGLYSLKILKDDETTVEMNCDAVASLSVGRSSKLSSELNDSRLDENSGATEWLTREPGYYVLRGGSIEDGAGVGLSNAFQSIRGLFAMLAGREDLNLYDILSKQNGAS